MEVGLNDLMTHSNTRQASWISVNMCTRFKGTWNMHVCGLISLSAGLKLQKFCFTLFCPAASHFTQNKSIIYDIKIQYQYIPLNKHWVFLLAFSPNTTTVPLFMVLTKSKQCNYHAGFQRLTMVLIKISFFWNMMLCSMAAVAWSSSEMFLPTQHYSITSKKTGI